MAEPKTISAEVVEASEVLDAPLDIVNTSIDIGKALKLRLKNGLSYREIAKQLGSNKATVHHALKPFMTLLKHPQAIEAFKSQEADLLDGARLQILRNLLDGGRLKKASVNNLAYAYTNLYNAQRLERGESTANVAYAELDGSLSEIRAERERLARELEGE